MHDFLAGFNFPESVLADQNDLFSVFATDFEKREFCKFSPKTTLFHIYWYYIVSVSTMHDFLAGVTGSNDSPHFMTPPCMQDTFARATHSA